MTGPEQGAGAGRGGLRAAHADRERVIEVLKAAFVQGRLDKDEFDARVGQVLASRTYAELAGLTADLPASPAAARPPGPARRQAPQPVARPAPVIVAVSALYAGLWACVLFGPSGAAVAAAPALALLTVFLIVTVIGIAIAMIASRQEKRRSGQLPPRPTPGQGAQAARRPLSAGPAGQHPPSAGPAGRHPPIEHGQQHTAEAAGRRPCPPAIAPAV